MPALDRGKRIGTSTDFRRSKARAVLFVFQSDNDAERSAKPYSLWIASVRPNTSDADAVATSLHLPFPIAEGPSNPNINGSPSRPMVQRNVFTSNASRSKNRDDT